MALATNWINTCKTDLSKAIGFENPRPVKGDIDIISSSSQRHLVGYYEKQYAGLKSALASSSRAIVVS